MRGAVRFVCALVVSAVTDGGPALFLFIDRLIGAKTIQVIQMTGFSDIPLFLSLWVLVGISLSYYKRVRKCLFFNPGKESISTIVLGFSVGIPAFLGAFIFLMWLGHGFEWMFYHPDLFSYFKWHYVYVFFYFSFMYIQRKKSLLIVKSYNKGVRRVIWDAFDYGLYSESPSKTYKNIREYYKLLDKGESERYDNKRSDAFEAITDEYMLDEDKVYSDVKELEDREFIRKRLNR